MVVQNERLLRSLWTKVTVDFVIHAVTTRYSKHKIGCCCCCSHKASVLAKTIAGAVLILDTTAVSASGRVTLNQLQMVSLRSSQTTQSVYSIWLLS